MTNTGPPTPAMRLSVAWICGSRMASQLALPLSNRRYAPCVLAQSPQASLIGEAGELTSCSAVLIKRRSKRLSDRSTPANSSHTHSTDAVPASMIACTSGSSHRAVFAKQPATLRRTSRRTQGYQMSAAVSSAPYAALSLTAQRSRLVWNRQQQDRLSVDGPSAVGVEAPLLQFQSRVPSRASVSAISSASAHQKTVKLGTVEPPVLALLKHWSKPAVVVVALLTAILFTSQPITPAYGALALAALLISRQVFGPLRLLSVNSSILPKPEIPRLLLEWAAEI